jgi:hypothetical protein
MSDRDRPGRAPESSSFAPVPVAPGGGRAPVLVAAVVLAILAGSFVLARLDPTQQPAQAVLGSMAPTPSTGQDTPVPTVAPPQPTATPLPAREWFTGPGAPMADVPILTADSIRWLRLGTAVHPDEPLAKPGRDLLMQGQPDGTVCLCWRTSGTESGDPTALELLSLDHDLRVRSRTAITLVDGIDGTGRANGPTQVALEPGPGGEYAYLARAVRSATTWQVSLDVIDLALARIVDTVDLLPVPATDRSDVLVVDPVTLRVAPDGRHVLVGSGVERETRDGRFMAVGRAWMVSLDGPTIGRVVRVDDIAEPGGERRLETCSWVAFASVDQLATGCRAGGLGSSPTFQVRRYTVLGKDLGAVDGDPALGDSERVLIDSANGVAYTWDPRTHTLFALDLAQGGWRRSTPSIDDRDAPDDLVRLAERPSPGPLPDWSDGRAATAHALEQTLIGSPDGSLLFAIGDGSTPGSSSGVRVFDARTLRLLERWPALASYHWLTAFDQGRFVALLGRPGLTSTGGPAEWGVSITVHDATTGGPVVRIGDSGSQMAIGFPWVLRRADAP